MTTQNEDFVTGELYLFHTSDADCPRETSLWGVVVRRTDDRTLLLKVCTRNPKQFVFGLQLPAGYRHCRLATPTYMRYVKLKIDTGPYRKSALNALASFSSLNSGHNL